MMSVIMRFAVTLAVMATLTGARADARRPVVDQVVSGEAELSVNITATMLDPRVELAGLLPDELQSWINFAAGVSRQAKAPDAAAAFVRFLHSPQANTAFQAVGMAPIGR